MIRCFFYKSSTLLAPSFTYVEKNNSFSLTQKKHYSWIYLYIAAFTLLKNIQSAITAMQGNIAKLANDNNKLSSDVAELRKVIAKNNDEVEKLKKDLVSRNNYVTSLELELGRVKKSFKATKE